jgi:hypothetical protein
MCTHMHTYIIDRNMFVFVSAFVLQVHYVVYPACLPWYGSLVAFLNIAYNTAARK